MIREPSGNSPIFSRCAVASPPKRARISRSASGCRRNATRAAAAAHWRVWSSGVAPIPPKLKTISPEAKLRLRAAVRRSGSSPRYCAQARRKPRLARAPMRKARCLSWRFPTRISSPMMKAPNAMSDGRAGDHAAFLAHRCRSSRPPTCSPLMKTCGTVARPAMAPTTRVRMLCSSGTSA